MIEAVAMDGALTTLGISAAVVTAVVTTSIYLVKWMTRHIDRLVGQNKEITEACSQQAGETALMFKNTVDIHMKEHTAAVNRFAIAIEQFRSQRVRPRHVGRRRR